MAENPELHELVQLLRKRFRDDSRYSGTFVVDGFAFRPESDSDDGGLLDRICSAYIKAKDDERESPQTFNATRWWREISDKNLKPVTRALATRDLHSLRSMYRNFFRDPCSTGLVGLPVDMHECYFGDRISAFYRDFFLGDALHRLDVWKSWTGTQFPFTALEAPNVGNPYGVLVDGVFIRIAAEYQHFYAQEIARLLGPAKAGTVMEIGGGFGGMASYLIRDHANVKYINFDVPETTALASYYLLKSFPTLRATLYGEAPITPSTLNESDVILMPSFELPKMPDKSVDIAYTSHVLRDMSVDVTCEYVDEIVRTTRSHILTLDRSKTFQLLQQRLNQTSNKFQLLRKRPVFWNSARALEVDELEYLFSATSMNDSH